MICVRLVVVLLLSFTIPRDAALPGASGKVLATNNLALFILNSMQYQSNTNSKHLHLATTPCG